MKQVIGLLLLATLAGCGADGEPVQPASNSKSLPSGGAAYASAFETDPASLQAPVGQNV